MELTVKNLVDQPDGSAKGDVQADEEAVKMCVEWCKRNQIIYKDDDDAVCHFVKTALNNYMEEKEDEDRNKLGGEED
jgi:hypothetical protein